MSNIEKAMENIFPVINVIGWVLICFSILMLILSLKKALRKMFLELAVLSAGCAIPILLISVFQKLMYMEPPLVEEKLFSWTDVLFFVVGILIFIIASKRKKDS